MGGKHALNRSKTEDGPCIVGFTRTFRSFDMRQIKFRLFHELRLRGYKTMYQARDTMFCFNLVPIFDSYFEMTGVLLLAQ